MSPKSLGIWIVDADGDRKRFIVRADERLTAFAKLEMGPPPLQGVLDNY